MKFFSSTSSLIAILIAATVWIRPGFGSWLTTADTRYDVQADQIRNWQADEEKSDRFVLVDVRDESEYSVSVLPGAITLDEFEAETEQHRGKVVIAYCTVGVRSGAYAAQLRQQGWDAYNYRGGILDWCQKKLSLITPAGQPTNRVHTYSSWYSVPASYLAVAR